MKTATSLRICSAIITVWAPQNERTHTTKRTRDVTSNFIHSKHQSASCHKFIAPLFGDSLYWREFLVFVGGGRYAVASRIGHTILKSLWHYVCAQKKLIPTIIIVGLLSIPYSQKTTIVKFMWADHARLPKKDDSVIVARFRGLTRVKTHTYI